MRYIEIIVEGYTIFVYPVVKLVHSVIMEAGEHRKKDSHFSAGPDTLDLKMLHLYHAEKKGITCHIPIGIVEDGDEFIKGNLILGKGGRILFEDSLRDEIEGYNEKAAEANRRWMTEMTEQIAEAKAIGERRKLAQKVRTKAVGVIKVAPELVWGKIKAELRNVENLKAMVSRSAPALENEKGDFDV